MEKRLFEDIAENEGLSEDLNQFILISLEQNEIFTIFKDAVSHYQDSEYLLNGLQRILHHFRESDHVYKAVRAFMEAVVQAMEHTVFDINERQKLDYTTIIYMHMPQMNSKRLRELANYLLILTKDDKQLIIWELIFSRMLQLIYDSYGQEYYRPFIEKILEYQLNGDNLITMTKFMQDLYLSKKDKWIFADRVCNNLDKLSPNDLGVLSHHLFKFTDNGKIIVGCLMSICSYFLNKLNVSFSTMSTQSEARWPAVSREYKQCEETILLHLNTESEFIVSENETFQALKPLTSLPALILNPMMITALLTFTKVNRQSDLNRISHSEVLKPIKEAIINNFIEEDIKKNSFYLNQSLPHMNTVDVLSVFKEILNDSETGFDIVTNGLLGLVFAMLKVRNADKLYSISYTFLTGFVKLRTLHGSAIMKTLLLFSLNTPQSNSIQFKEALMRVTTNSYHDISTHIDIFKTFFEDMPMIDGDRAVDFLPIVLPLLKSSTQIRDCFIAMIKKSLHQHNVQTRKMGVYGACLLLKQLKYETVANASQHFKNTSCFTLNSYSIMNRMTQINVEQPTMQNIIVLEVLSLLSVCLNQDVEIKETLYKGMMRTISLNVKIIPCIVDFIFPQFKKYCKISAGSFILDLKQIIKQAGETIIIKDHFGCLSQLMVYCLLYARSPPAGAGSLKELIEKASESIYDYDLTMLGCLEVTPANTIRTHQFYNFIESIMTYEIFKIKSVISSAGKIINLFDKIIATQKKFNDLKNVKIPGKRRKLDKTKYVSILDLDTLAVILKVAFKDPQENEATITDGVKSIRNHEAFKEYLITGASNRLFELKCSYNCIERKYSKKAFDAASECCRIIFQEIRSLSKQDFQSKLSLLLLNSLEAGTVSIKYMFDWKYNDYLQKLADSSSVVQSENAMIIINSLIDSMKMFIDDFEIFEDHHHETSIACRLFSIIEILLSCVPADSTHCPQLYSFVHDFACKYKLKTKQLEVVFKVLFQLREKTTAGDFYLKISQNILHQFGMNSGESVHNSDLIMKALTKQSREHCAKYLFETLSGQLKHIAYLIKKGNAYLAIQANYPGKTNIDLEPTKRIETVAIVMLINMCKVLRIISDAAIGVGPLMQTFTKLLDKFYMTLYRLTLYIKSRKLSEPTMDLSAVKYEMLLSLTRPLTKVIGQLILYVEKTSTIETQKLDISNEAKANKVLRDAKNIPNLVFAMEKFSCTVILFSKAIKQDLNELISLGTVRDFRINTEALMRAVERRRQMVQANEDDE